MLPKKSVFLLWVVLEVWMVYVVLPYGAEKAAIAAGMMMFVGLALLANHFLQEEERQNKAVGRVLTETGCILEKMGKCLEAYSCRMTHQALSPPRSEPSDDRSDKLPGLGQNIDIYA